MTTIHIHVPTIWSFVNKYRLDKKQTTWERNRSGDAVVGLLRKCVVTSWLCEGRYRGCCDGYYWNAYNGTCEGYGGSNCTSPCPYPTYGDRCQGICDCDNNSCDVSTGCRTPTTVIPEDISSASSMESTASRNYSVIFK
uniref:Cell death abnormality protein 1-like n=1 Tax=Crassostrea virginica TaxID=6565 RepID=A0A8B8AGT2_CRAVI|nr:cell death abnormality protein 1-like [Crassostrea virginica]